MAVLELGSFYSSNVDDCLTKTERWEARDVSFGTFSKKSKATAKKTSKVKLNTPSPALKEKNEDEKSFWEKYKKIILITTGVVLVGAAVVTVIILTAGTATPIAGSAMGSGLAAIAEGLDEAEHPTVLSVENVARSVLEKSNHVCYPVSEREIVVSGTSTPETFDTNYFPIDSFKPNYFPTNLEQFWMNNASSSGVPTKELPQLNEAPAVEQSEVVYPSCLKRNLPVFTSDNLPTTQTWGEWFLGNQYMDCVADSEIRPALPHNNTSMTFRTTGEYHPTVRIGGINGIGNHLNDAILNSEYLKKFTGGLAVEWVYNCSNNHVVDAVEAAVVNMSGYSPNTADLLRENWIAFHEENKNNPNAKYFQNCHSQGAIHVKNALEGLPSEIRDRVIVLAIAPATVIPDDLCYRAYNYASKSDIVPHAELFIKVAEKALVLDADLNKRLNTIVKNRNELIILEPHPDSGLIDHGYQSITFEEVIDRHIKQYLKNKGVYYD